MEALNTRFAIEFPEIGGKEPAWRQAAIIMEKCPGQTQHKPRRSPGKQEKHADKPLSTVYSEMC